MKKENICLPTCEVSMDPETALELGREWGINHFEIKTLWDTRIPYITDKQREHLKSIVRNYSVHIAAISPGLFINSEAREDVAKKELGEKLPLSLEFANEFGVKYMVLFSFRRTEGVSENWAIDKIGQAADAAGRAKVELVMEPLTNHYADSGASMSRIVRAVNNPYLRVNWDPGNVRHAGYSPYPGEYRYIKDLVGYTHLKDCAADPQTGKRKWVVFGDGEVDLKGQLAALKQDGYQGYLTIETHTRYNKEFGPIIDASRRNYETLTKWLSELE